MGEKVKNNPYLQPNDVRDYRRFLYSNAVACVLDRQGRILIPPPLRDFAKLTKEVVLLGIDRKIEIWAAEQWQRKKEVLSQHDHHIRETLSGLGF